MKKIPWTAERTIITSLLTASVAILMIGIYLSFVGNQMLHTTPINGEDLTPFLGGLESLIGAGLVIIGAVLVLLFTWLYRRVMRRLKLNQLIAPKLSVSKSVPSKN